MNDKIAIIYTTFLRDELMNKTFKFIIDNWQDNYTLLIGDQNNITKRKMMWINTWHYQLPYDCGLSFARNFLIQKASDLHIAYCLISADSIAFTSKYDFDPIIKFIQSRDNNAIVGFHLNNRQSFKYDLTLDKELGKFILDKPKRDIIIHNNISYRRCDIISNFFIAPTKLLLNNKWDNRLKMGEHEVFFNQLKENNVEVFHTKNISADYITEKPDEYKQKRNRLYSEFIPLMRKLYGLTNNSTGWIQYNYKIIE